MADHGRGHLTGADLAQLGAHDPFQRVTIRPSHSTKAGVTVSEADSGRLSGGSMRGATSRWRRVAAVAAVGAAVLGTFAAAPAAQAADTAPGAPGQTANWTRGDKTGFGTSTTLTSTVWFTLGTGELSEVYYPDLGTPATRDLRFAITDGRRFLGTDTAAVHTTQVVDPHSLTYRQIDTDPGRRWRLTKTFVTDPARAAMQVQVHFESLVGSPLRLYVIFDPALSKTGDDDTGSTVGGALVAADSKAASALVAQPAFDAESSGYLGTSDGWTDLQDYRMDWTYPSAPTPGNIVQTGQAGLSGKKGGQDMTLALGFGPTGATALSIASSSLQAGFAATQSSYQSGWHDYLAPLARPGSASGHQELYDVSVMALAAMEDKRFRGAMIAAPSMAWIWGNLAGYSGPYHLVWSRDLYEIATGRLAAGDRAGADRALHWLWNYQQKPDGCFPQNSQVDGTPEWGGLQLDEVADPILLAGQLGEADADTYSHVRRAVGCILANGPVTQERWENATGYSPSSLAAQIAGLVVAAAIGDANGDATSAASWRATADRWRSSLRRWTVTRNGPLAEKPYFLRLTVDGNANAGTTYQISDGGPVVDQRTVVDPGYLELVRLGVLAASDADILSTMPVVDRELGVTTPNGTFWHRYEHDGYGETLTGGDFPGDGNTGRLWPIFAGERGEYELAAGQLSGDVAGGRAAATHRLDDMARTANAGLMMPEQVWDTNPPVGSPGYATGTPTRSSTPLGWSHAQFVRLAWSIDAGRPVETPAPVACRYQGC